MIIVLILAVGAMFLIGRLYRRGRRRIAANQQNELNDLMNNIENANPAQIQAQAQALAQANAAPRGLSMARIAKIKAFRFQKGYVRYTEINSRIVYYYSK